MNCKPGDLAYIVDSFFPENIGAVVEVIGGAGLIDGFFAWNFKSVRRIRGMIPGCPRPVTDTEGTIHDICLRPISGVPVEDETPIETNVPEAVKLAWGIDAPVLS